MRFLKITIPLGVLFAAVGVFLMLQSPTAEPPPPLPVTRHTVTKKMETITGGWARRTAPGIDMKDASGAQFDLKQSLEKGPVFLYFIKEDCPCSVDAQPLFNRLRNKFKDKVSFAGIIDVDAAKGKKWAEINAMTDPMLPDPKLKLIHSYKATNSTFSALVLQDGTILKMWPGYSAEYLQDMNTLFAKALGEPVTKFDTAYAPAKRTAGCYFE